MKVFGSAILMYLFICTLSFSQDAVVIGSRLELFVDPFLVDSSEGLTCTLHPPRPREIAIVHDEVWEGNTSGYHTVFEDGDLFRMYYRGSHHDAAAKSMAHEQVVCYAESEDGIHWIKPNLGVYTFAGSDDNNIIWTGEGAHNFAPFLDSNPACPKDETYKAMGGGEGGLYAFVSADGVHWQKMVAEPIFTKGMFDSQNNAFWSELENTYVCYFRSWSGDGFSGYRQISRTTSTDFINWSDPVELDYFGAPLEHLYTNQIIPYDRAEHIYIGFPKRFFPGKNPMQFASGGVSDAVFMSSRDGIHFKRRLSAYIRPGLQKEQWICRNNMVARGLLKTYTEFDDHSKELSLYVGEGYYQGESDRLRRYTQRLDGFVSLHGDYDGGWFVSKPLIFRGNTLLINVSTSAAGFVMIELLNKDGNPIPGFSLARAPKLCGDDIAMKVHWNSSAVLADYQTTPVRLRCYLKDADLYAIQFKYL